VTPKNVVKGSRIRAEWMQANDPPSSLAGMQAKVGARRFEVVGTVKHLRGDAAVYPQNVRFYVDPDHVWDGPTVTPPGCTCGHSHVEIHPEHVVAIQE
jgi:hypothetical protein